MAHGLSSRVAWVPEHVGSAVVPHRLSSCGRLVSCSTACGILVL